MKYYIIHVTPPSLLAHCHTVKEVGDYCPTVLLGEILDDSLNFFLQIRDRVRFPLVHLRLHKPPQEDVAGSQVARPSGRRQF